MADEKKEVSFDLTVLLAFAYEAFSDMLQRGDMFGIQPKQSQIDQIWLNELQPRIMLRLQRASKNVTPQEKPIVKEDTNELAKPKKK
jgi:hypothetical protein